jgi:hypothetical protein
MMFRRPWGNRLSGRYLPFRELQQPTRCADGGWNSWLVEDFQFGSGLVWDTSASDRCYRQGVHMTAHDVIVRGSGDR